jgi:hypothetical protein
MCVHVHGVIDAGSSLPTLRAAQDAVLLTPALAPAAYRAGNAFHIGPLSAEITRCFETEHFLSACCPAAAAAAAQETKVFWDFRKGLIPIIGGSR